MSPSSPRGTKISHIGIAVRALGEAAPLFAKIIGFDAGGSLVELLEASDDASPIGRFVAKRGPGIHHVCFAVDDLDGTLARCRAHGLRLIDESPRLGAEGKRIAFIHPSSTAGVLVELSER